MTERSKRIFQILLELNRGDCSYRGSKVQEAILQYEEFEEKVLKKEEDYKVILE